MPLPEAKPIAEVHGVDRRTFDEEIRPAGQPVVMRNLAADWPAVAAAKRSDQDLVDYMKAYRLPHPVGVIVGDPAIRGRFFYSDDLKAMNFGQGTSRLDPFLDRLLRDRDNPHPFAIALQSLPIPELLPGFEAENRTGLLDNSVVPRMWMGNAARVAAHFDLMENIGCVVAGRRRFTLFPPDQLPNLYVGPLELTPAGTPVSLVDLAAPDLERFPRFVLALEAAQSAELSPGDAIYIPFHWWHAVDSLEPINLFVNYWWNDTDSVGRGNPYDVLLHGLLSIKGLPSEQRQAWRTVFDHYVFCASGDPAEHLPPDVRGVLGEPTPQQLAMMRATLRQALQRVLAE
jgi:hypothetical protein